MISPADRRHAIGLIDEAVMAGAWQRKACEVLEISVPPTSAGRRTRPLCTIVVPTPNARSRPTS